MVLIKNGYVIEPKSKREGQADILIEETKIKEIYWGGIGEESAPEPSCVIDAAGKYIFPGLVDVHVHFREPGFEYKEDISTGAKASARGGITTVVMMANTKPILDNEEGLDYVYEKAKEAVIKVRTCAAVSKGFEGKEFVDYKSMMDHHAVGFTDDGMPLMDEVFLEEAMRRIKELDVPISLHEEDPRLIAQNGINRGRASSHFGIEGSPKEAEVSMVARDVEIAKKTGVTLSVQHISCKEAVEIIRRAKRQGYDHIHAEAAPHHFTLTEDAVIEYGTLAKMNPPLRGEEDRMAIIEGILDGTLEIIGTDHAPHSKEEKERELTKAPSGIIGLETSLSLAFMELVEKHHMSLTDLMDRMSYFPAKMYHLEAGYIEKNGPADLVIFDPGEEWVVKEFASKSWNSPFLGKTLKGKVKMTICDGRIVYSEE